MRQSNGDTGGYPARSERRTADSLLALTEMLGRSLTEAELILEAFEQTQARASALGTRLGGDDPLPSDRDEQEEQTHWAIVHARSFVLALHRAVTVLDHVAKLSGSTDAVAAAKALAESLPALVDVRDSIARLDERIQALTSDLENQQTEDARPVVAIDRLDGTNYCISRANGEMGSIAVTNDTLQLAIERADTVLRSLDWS